MQVSPLFHTHCIHTTGVISLHSWKESTGRQCELIAMFGMEYKHTAQYELYSAYYLKK